MFEVARRLGFFESSRPFMRRYQDVARKKIYCVANDAGETTMVIAASMLEALTLWRVEEVGTNPDIEDAEEVWPSSIALVHDGTILGEYK